MDAALFTKMLSDKSILDLRKLSYKFPKADIREFVELLKNGFYHSLPLKDFSGQNLAYLPSIAQVHLSAAKVLLTPRNSTCIYGVKAMEEEIISTFTIEQVDFTRDSVRKILSGLAPADESESRIFGMKRDWSLSAIYRTKLPKRRFTNSMKRPSELIFPRKIVYFPAISIDMTASMLSAQR